MSPNQVDQVNQTVKAVPVQVPVVEEVAPSAAPGMVEVVVVVIHRSEAETVEFAGRFFSGTNQRSMEYLDLDPTRRFLSVRAQQCNHRQSTV